MLWTVECGADVYRLVVFVILVGHVSSCCRPRVMQRALNRDLR
jgi:hypothetical protein